MDGARGDEREAAPDPSALTQILSARECDIVVLLAKGYSNRAIADSLHIAVGTVKRHLANAYPKLGVGSRLAAALRVRQFVGSGDERASER